MKYRLAIAAVLLALVSGTGRVQAGNLLVNGSFEDPVIPPGTDHLYNGGQPIGSAGWTAVGVNVDLVQTTYAEPFNGITAFNAQQGLNSMDLTGAFNSGPTSGVTQTVSTTVGQTYDLSFYVGRADGGSFYSTPATDDLSINGGPSVSYTNSNATPGFVNWEQFTTSFVAVGPTTTITFLNGTPVQTALAGLDNVVLSLASGTVPEPSTLTLLGIGAASLFCFVKRRRS
ncbi:MAG: PEP-CTERM sorting domain-containing protein [Isosphaeraceae bacterium]